MVGFCSFSALAAATSVLPLAIFASPLQSEVRNLQSRQNDYFVVHGIEDGGIQPRLNIRDLAGKSENKELWTLYLLAIQRLQAVDQKEKLSYYQVAGIHGQPWIPWDGVPSWTDEPRWGYCPHNGNLFATWHRPYVLLYEQLLYQHVLAIVDEIKDASTKTRYQAASKKFRVPYWDWSEKPPAGEHVLPDIIAKTTTSITYPNGTTATIANPLWGYTFHPLQPEDFPVPDGFTSPYDHWNRTIHLPSPPDSTDPIDDLATAHNRVDGNLGYARDSIYKLFKSYQRFNQFSNQAPGFNISIGNLETVHGSIHDSFLNGHFQFPVTSAFDPLFYLHHANVDRYLAMWQAVYPDTFVDSVRATRQSTFTLDAFAEDPVGADTPLHPFHRNTAGDFWTSNLVRDITKLGYTYPELMDKPSNDTLKARVNALYYDAPKTTLTRRQEGDIQTTRDYNARIELPTGYSASVFLGEPGDNPINWPADEQYAGSFSTKFNVGLSLDDNVLNGLVGLSRKIAKAHEDGKLQSVDEKAVVSYLKANLKLKIVGTDGKEVPASNVAKFKVEVFSQLETVPKSDSEFPVVLETKEYPEITA